MKCLFEVNAWISKLNERHPLRPIIYHCLQIDPSKRPTMNQLLENYLGNLYNRLSLEAVAKAHTEMLLYFNQVATPQIIL